MENSSELEIILRSLLTSTPKVTTANQLLRDFAETEGYSFPFKKLGFNSFVDYLKSIPAVVKLVPYNSFNPEVQPIATSQTKHIESLVLKQRPKRSRPISSRRGGYNGGRFAGRSVSIPPRRRPPATFTDPASLSRYQPAQTLPTPYKVPTAFQPVFMKEILWELVKAVANSKSGLTVQDIENRVLGKYSREDLSSNGMHSANDLLRHASQMVECVDGRVYSKMPSGGDRPVQSNTNKNEHQQVTYIPAGDEKQSDEECNDIDWENDDEETISNYTLSYFSNSNSTYPSNDSTKREFQDDEECNYNLEKNFSKTMISNFRSILEKNPDGIWSTELPQKYFEEFHSTLELQDLGFSSVIIMASLLPNVFTYQRESSHDWKLYDARKVKQIECLNDNIDSPDPAYQDNNETYVPQSILENVKKLAELYPGGFRSTDLRSLYQSKFNKTLDIAMLGFSYLEDFLETLKSVISLIKCKDYYLVFPKKSSNVDQLYEPSKQLEQTGALQLPFDAVITTLPENIMRPSDTMPHQLLPDVKLVAQSNEPLIEVEVRVAEVISPDLFYIFLDANYNELQSFMDRLDQFYNLEEDQYHIPLPSVTLNLFCVCKYEDTWHRAKVTGFRKNNFIEIEYIDYGTPGQVKRSELRFLHNDFAKFPSQSICAKLLGIKPPNEAKLWPRTTSSKFLDLVLERRLLAHIFKVGTHRNKERIQVEVILYDTNSDKQIIINEHLVEQSLAVFVNQAEASQEEPSSPAVSQSVNYSGNSNQPKQAPRRPPPGFENQQLFERPQVVPNQQSYFQLNYYPHQNGFSPRYQQTPVTQINHFVTVEFSSLFPTQHSIPQNEYHINPITNQLHYQFPSTTILNNQLYPWSQNDLITPPPIVSQLQPPPPYNFLSHSNNATPLTPHINVQSNIKNSSMDFNSGGVRNVFNYSNRGIGPSNKETIPGVSCDLSQPKQAEPVRLQPTLVPEDKLVSKGRRSATVSLQMRELNEEKLISRPTTPFSPSSLSKDTELYHEKWKSEEQEKEIKLNNGNLYEKTSKYSKKPQKSNKPMSDDEYVSASDDIIKDSKQFNLKKSATTDCKRDVGETIPDSWEDIDPDNRPAPTKNFPEDIQNKLYFLNQQENNMLPNVNIPADVNSKENINKANETTVSLSEKLKSSGNWKDLFNPDVANNNRLSCEEMIRKKNTSSKLKNLLKTKVEKFEINNKVFHLIWVNNKAAVLSQEFYPQFVDIKWHVIDKLVEVKQKPFTVISKTTAPALFSELQKTQFSDGIDKSSVLKLNRASISYLSEVPEILAILNVNDKTLLTGLNDLKIVSEKLNC